MTQATNPAQTPTSVLDSLVGNGKKFATPEDLARGKQEADSFIETLKREKAEALDLATRQDSRIKSLESKISILDRLAVNPPDAVTPPVQTQTQSQPSTPGLTAEDVLKVVEQRELNVRQKSNKTEVDNGLVKAFGANATQEVLKRCTELGVDPSEFNQLAVNSPKAAFALLQINPNAPAGSSVYKGAGHDPMSINGRPEVRNQAWYEAKKREMGAVKFMRDAKLMIQRHNDMIALGDNWDN